MSAIDDQYNQQKSLNLAIFNVLRGFFVMLFVVYRGSLFIIENEEEINLPLLWSSTISVVAIILYINWFRDVYTFDEFLCAFTAVNIASGIISIL